MGYPYVGSKCYRFRRKPVRVGICCNFKKENFGKTANSFFAGNLKLIVRLRRWRRVIGVDHRIPTLRAIPVSYYTFIFLNCSLSVFSSWRSNRIRLCAIRRPGIRDRPNTWANRISHTERPFPRLRISDIPSTRGRWTATGPGPAAVRRAPPAIVTSPRWRPRICRE